MLSHDSSCYLMLISHTILWFLLLSPIIKYYNVPSCACYRMLSCAIFCYPMLSCAISCYLMLISHTITWYLRLSPNFKYCDMLSCAILCYPLVLCLISQTFWLTHWLSEWVIYICDFKRKWWKYWLVALFYYNNLTGCWRKMVQGRENKGCCALTD